MKVWKDIDHGCLCNVGCHIEEDGIIHECEWYNGMSCDERLKQREEQEREGRLLDV